MIIAHLQGGLGNQLFQYAMARSVAEQWGSPLTIDHGMYSSDFFRSYQLSLFRVKTSPLTWLDRRSIYLAYSHKLRGLRPFLYRIAPTLRLDLIEDRMRGFDPFVFERRRRPFFKGFWQSEKYFAGIRPTLLSELQFREPTDAANTATLREIEGSNAVCVHVRRTDYLKYSEFSVLAGEDGAAYYRSAIEYIRERVSDPSFYVFSDDPQWARSNLNLGANAHFLENNLGIQDHEDLRLMVHCKHFIIANSTFSWWGAWLANHLEKIVIAPRLWRRDNDLFNADITPASWVRL